MARKLLTALLAALILCVPAVEALGASGHHKHKRHSQKRHHKRQVRKTDAAGDRKRVCVYASHHISMLQTFGRLVGRNIDCAMAFNDASPDWAGWERPWFIRNTYPDMNWGKWATEPGQQRQLVITQNMFPSSENNSDWLTIGAAGGYDLHARALATNLVAAGLGNTIIRLGHEANGTWYADSLPNTPAGNAQWVQLWRNIVLAMKSVPGANFKFDWTVSSGYRNIPPAQFYPGDDVVDIVGIDAYDAGVPAGRDRWQYVYTRPLGIREMLTFAQAHGKPLSIPEWGVEPASDPKELAGGDNPVYVNALADVVANNAVAYHAYFNSGDTGTQFFNSPLSIAAYRQRFGAQGTSVLAADRGEQNPPASPAPSLAVTGGPPDNATVDSRSLTYTVQAASGSKLVCSLDWEAFRPCSSSSHDALSNLPSGYHFWRVQTSDDNSAVSLYGRTFVVSKTATTPGTTPARPGSPVTGGGGGGSGGSSAVAVDKYARIVAARLRKSRTVRGKRLPISLAQLPNGTLCLAVVAGWSSGTPSACTSKHAWARARRVANARAIVFDPRPVLRRAAGRGKRKLTVLATFQPAGRPAVSAAVRVRVAVRRR